MTYKIISTMASLYALC